MNQAREGTESALPRPLALGALWGLPSGDFRGSYKAMPQGKQKKPPTPKSPVWLGIVVQQTDS